MQALDQTIANVALPYMQGSLSATYDEITWVLTSYITAAAIMTAPVGWLAARFGRKYLFITCLVGFTVTSMMCGAAQSLTQMVVFRLLQGVFGAALVPLSQSTMMDIYPVEQRGKAMAIWGVGVMVGPILGPTLGGYLTEMYNWRYVFYINLPFGILATLGLVFFMPRVVRQLQPAVRLDRLRRAVAGHRRPADDARPRPGPGLVHLHRDHRRGGAGRPRRLPVHRPHDDGEEAVHSAGAVQGPEFRRRAGADVRDRHDPGVQFIADGAMAAELWRIIRWRPPGLIMAPRGIGTMTAMMTGGRLSSKIDPRKLMAGGILMLAWSMWEMTAWTPDVSQWTIVMTIMVQGAGLGFVFLPLQVLAFATLPPQYRTDGASLFSLFRNIGAAIGVSVTSAMLAHNTQVLHESIGASVTPFNRALAGRRDGEPALEPAARRMARRCWTRWSTSRRRSSPISTTTG